MARGIGCHFSARQIIANTELLSSVQLKAVGAKSAFVIGEGAGEARQNLRINNSAIE